MTCLAIQAFAATVRVTDAPPAAITRFLRLFDQLRVAQAQAAHGNRQRVSFRVSEAEINEYMQYSLRARPRPGVESMTIKIFPHNYISTFTVVDFDAVERWHPGTLPVLLRPMLNGRKSIWVDFRIRAQDSRIGFSVEKARYQNIWLPAFFVNKAIEIVAARQPEKYDTSKPIPIPFGLRQLWTSNQVLQGQN
jgi:hypothetical protein